MDSRHTKNQYIKKVILCLVIFSLFFPLSVNAAPAEFFYDAQGPLIGIKDETGSMAVHRYDAVGNLLSIDTFSPTTGNVGIFLLLPEKGVVGETIDIQGFGFSDITTDNTITFNGTPATVVSARFDVLTVIVPLGATTGPVVVTNTTGTAASPQVFTVLDTPTIFSIDPNRVAKGTSNVMQISGANLSGATGISFSSGNLTAIFLSSPEPARIRIKLVVAAATLSGNYAFTVHKPTGDIQSSAVTVTVLNAEVAFSPSRKGFSVFIPFPESLAPSGPVLTAVPGPSIFLPSPDAIAPSGIIMTVAPSESVSMPE